MDNKEAIRISDVKITMCKDCKYFDKYNVECEKGHNPKPPYNEWFCAEGRADKEVT